MQMEVRTITVGYREVPVLDQVSLQIGAGELVGIIGCTGCGKTTLLKAMAGLIEVQGGEILLDGENIFARRFDRAILRKKVGMVFQYPEYQLFAQTVEKDVGFGLKYSRLGYLEKQERIRWALEQMGFSYEEIKDQSPLALSGGEKRRVAIAGVLATKPELLMLDEPLAGLDPMAREAFLEFLERLTRQGVSVVMVSHNVDALAEHAGRIIGMKNGKIVLDGSCREVLGDSRALRKIGLLGSEAAQTAELLQANGVLPAVSEEQASGVLEAASGRQASGVLPTALEEQTDGVQAVASDGRANGVLSAASEGQSAELLRGLPVTYEALRDEIIGALIGKKGENG